MSFEKYFTLLPSMKDFERNLSMKEADRIGAHACGDKTDGKEIYKLLTREGFMLTYLCIGEALLYYETNPLVPF